MGPLARIQKRMCAKEAARLAHTGESCSAQWAELNQQRAERTARKARVEGLTERTIDNRVKR